MGEQGTGQGIAGDLVLDTGALIAFERGDRRVAALVKKGRLPGNLVIPASALAQAWRGGPRSAKIATLVKGAKLDALDEFRAKEIGVRLRLRDAADIADAHVVCCAGERHATIATSDPADIHRLTAVGEPISVIAV